MPYRDSESFIREAVESVLAQSYRHWELICISDQSTDQSTTILKSISVTDKRIKIFQNNGRGIIDALETGHYHAKGEYISRFDSDDIMHKNRLSLFIGSGLSKKVVATGLVRYFSKTRVSNGYIKYENWLNSNLCSDNPWKNIYRECVIASPNWMIKSNDFNEIGGFKNLVYPEDYDLVFRLFKNKYQINTVNQTTLYWREHPNRTSRISLKYSQQSFFDLKIQRFVEIENPIAPVLIWGKGKKAKMTKNILRKYGISSILFSESNFKQTEKYVFQKLLISVFPSPTERKILENELQKMKFVIGINCWYV